MENKLQYFDIILFAVIAGVLAVRLFRILGVKSKVVIEKKDEPVPNVVSIKKEQKLKTEDVNIEDGEGLEHLQKIQPDFTEDSFLAGAEKALVMLLEAKYKANKKTLISFLEDDIFRIFEKQILDQESNGHTIEDCDLRVTDKHIQEIKIQDSVAYIRVNFKYNEKYLIKNSDGSIFLDLSKDGDERTVAWTFSRPIASDSPNWKLFGVNQIN